MDKIKYTRNYVREHGSKLAEDYLDLLIDEKHKYPSMFESWVTNNCPEDNAKNLWAMIQIAAGKTPRRHASHMDAIYLINSGSYWHLYESEQDEKSLAK